MTPAELAGRLRGALWDKQKKQAADDVVASVNAALDKAAPRKTGTFANSRVTTRNRDGGASIRYTASYAAFVINPTRPHEIRATRAKSLHFMIGSQHVFAKSIHHPGTKGNDFIPRTLLEQRAIAERTLADAGGRFFATIVG